MTASVRPSLSDIAMRICGLKNRRDLERSIERSVVRRDARGSWSILGISSIEIQSRGELFEAEFPSLLTLANSRKTLKRRVTPETGACTGI
jgi:hypothetical protein